MKYRSYFIAVSMLIFSLAVLVCPLSAAEIPVISTQELQTKIDAGEPVFLLNPLADIIYNEGYIPGSVNIPTHELKTTDKLPADKAMLIVSYCLGPKWVVSKEAAGLVAEKGYTNVKWYREGIPAWVKAGNTLDKQDALPKVEVPTLSADALKDMVADVYVVDIRPTSLYKMGWIGDSHKIPMAKLSADYEGIPKAEKIVIQDHSGKQTLIAGRFLKSKGYPEVFRLQGGLMAWTRKGYPLEK